MPKLKYRKRKQKKNGKKKKKEKHSPDLRREVKILIFFWFLKKMNIFTTEQILRNVFLFSDLRNFDKRSLRSAVTDFKLFKSSLAVNSSKSRFV